MDHYEMPASLSIPYGNIDAEHQAIIEILNPALRLIQMTQDAEVHLLFPYLEELRSALKLHFAHEEQEMAQLDYPDLAPHKRHHAHCVQRLDEICDAVVIGQKKADKDLFDELYDMIMDDIIRADSGFKSFLQAQEICACS
ncbi:MAG: bacteriohemerythrin [Rhizomicrobium sp.]